MSQKDVTQLAKQEKAITREKLAGMQVIDAQGHALGTVKDIAFTVGKTGVSLHVEDKKGQGRDITWEEVQAVGDFIILKPTTQTATTQTAQPKEEAKQICPTCKEPLSYIEQYQRWYCYKCKKYC